MLFRGKDLSPIEYILLGLIFPIMLLVVLGITLLEIAVCTLDDWYYDLKDKK